MTDAPDYDAIEALRAKAEWGEWYVSTEGVGVNVYARAFEEGYGTHVADCTDDDPFDRKAIPNAELIVAAVNTLPALIARCRELEAKVAGIRELAPTLRNLPDMYRHLVMDTPKDQALHDNVTRVSDQTLDLLDTILDSKDQT